jgi:hypothetical protein
MRRENTFVPEGVKNYIHSGVEKRYLGRLITSRPRFDSGPRNKYRKIPILYRYFSLLNARGRKQIVLLSSGIEASEYIFEQSEVNKNSRSRPRKRAWLMNVMKLTSRYSGTIPGPSTVNKTDH